MVERLRVMDFMVAVGLPVTFEELGIGDISREQLMELATGFAGPGSIAHNHVFTVTPFDLYSAMIAADTCPRLRQPQVLGALGRARRSLAGK